mmetsp:Transcript_4817/g.11771  ORF Transcript_4817/g.11771 Transcript_4817/m.11771 type:complete len:262 (-) Transcript_4817:71-856(-)
MSPRPLRLDPSEQDSVGWGELLRSHNASTLQEVRGGVLPQVAGARVPIADEGAVHATITPLNVARIGAAGGVEGRVLAGTARGGRGVVDIVDLDDGEVGSLAEPGIRRLKLGVFKANGWEPGNPVRARDHPHPWEPVRGVAADGGLLDVAVADGTVPVSNVVLGLADGSGPGVPHVRGGVLQGPQPCGRVVPAARSLRVPHGILQTALGYQRPPGRYPASVSSPRAPHIAPSRPLTTPCGPRARRVGGSMTMVATGSSVWM